MSERRWLALALVLVLLGFADPVALGRTLVGFDHALEFYPAWTFERASILRGELPLWDPRSSAGTPHLAAIYSGALDPIRWVFFPLPSVLGYTLHLVFLHLVATAGAFRLARALGARPAVAAFAGVLLGASGILRSFGGFESALSSAALVPWVLLVPLELARAPSLRVALRGGALAALLVLAGGPEYALASCVLLGATALWRGWLGRREAGALRPAGLALLAGLLAAPLAAGVLLPGFELSRISTRRFGVDPSQVYAHATHPLELATLLLPGILGSSAREPRPLGAALFDQSYFLPVLYPGALSVLLLPFAPWRRRSVRGLGAVLLLAAWFALGAHAGLFTLVLEACPPLKVFRYAYKAWAFAAPALAVLGALGLERILESGIEEKARRALLGVAGLALLVAAAGALAWLFPEAQESVRRRLLPAEPQALMLSELSESAATLAVRGLVLAFFAAALAWRPRGALVLAALAVLDLTVVTRGATPWIEKELYEKPPALAAFFQGTPPPRFYPASRDEPLPRAFERAYGTSYWEYDKERLRQDLATVWDLEQLHRYSPGKLAWMNQLEGELECARDAAERTRLLAALGVELVVSRVPLENAQLAFVGRAPGAHWLYRLRSARPRYEVLAGARTFETHRAALDALGRAPADVLLLRRDGEAVEPEDWRPIADADVRLSLADPRLSEAAPPASAAAVVRYEPRRIELELSGPAAEGSWLLARDAFEPRWRASVDGVALPVVRADFAFRAVKLPAGARRVVFEYDASLARGAFAFQLLAWTAWLALLLARPRAVFGS